MGAIHRLDRVGDRPRRGSPPSTRRSSSTSTTSTARSRPGTIPTPRSTRPSPSSAASVPPRPRRPPLCWGDSRIGNMIFADDGSRGGGARLGDGDSRRPGAGPGLVPAARPAPPRGLRRARACPGSPTARPSIARWEAGQRPLRRAPRLVRAPRRRPLRADPHPGHEAPRHQRACSPARRRWPTTRPAASCCVASSTSGPDAPPPTEAPCSRPSTTCRSTRSPQPIRPAGHQRSQLLRPLLLQLPPVLRRAVPHHRAWASTRTSASPTPSPSCAAATSTGWCGPPASSASTGWTPRSGRSGSR